MHSESKSNNQLDCYITAKITHMYSGHAQSRDPILFPLLPLKPLKSTPVTSKNKPGELILKHYQPTLGLFFKVLRRLLAPIGLSYDSP